MRKYDILYLADCFGNYFDQFWAILFLVTPHSQILLLAGLEVTFSMGLPSSRIWESPTLPRFANTTRTPGNN